MISIGDPISVKPISTILTYVAMAFVCILGLLIVSRILNRNKCTRMGFAMLTFLAWLYARMPHGMNKYNALPPFTYTFEKYLSSVPFGNIAYSQIEPVAKYRMYIYLFYLTTFLLAFFVAKFLFSLYKSSVTPIVFSFVFLILLEVITLLLNFYQIIVTMYDYASFILIPVGIMLAWLWEKNKKESVKKGESRV